MDAARLDENDPAVQLAGDIARRVNENNPQGALDPRLLADVATLRRLVSKRTSDSVPATAWSVLVDYTAATVHWARSRHLGAVDGKGDLLAAAELFRPIYDHEPGYVPWVIRSLYENAADIVDGKIVEHASAWTGQGLELLNQVAEHRDLDVLDRALALLHKAADVTPAQHPHRGERLTNLCAGLLMRHQLTGDPQSLDDAVAVAREAESVTGEESPFRADCLYGLGMALGVRARSIGEQAAEDEAIEVLSQAATTMAGGHPKLVACLQELGLRLGLKAATARDVTTLERAVGFLQQAVATIDEHDPGYLDLLERLGMMLQMLHERTGSQQAAADSIAVLRRAVDRTPATHPAHSRHHCHLATACRQWYETTGEAASIEESVTLSRAALADSTSISDRAFALGELGSALTLRYRESGDLADLREAVDRLHEATSSDPGSAPSLSMLGSALLSLHVATGDRASLDEAIQAGRAAISASSRDDPLRTLRQSMVGRMLWHRGELTGDWQALAEAITVLSQAVDEAPDDHPLQFTIRTNLGAALAEAYRQTESAAAIDQAVAAHKWVVDRMPDDHVKRGQYLGNLGASLFNRYRVTGDPSALDTAVATMRDAVCHAPERELPGFLSNLANALVERHGLTGATVDLDLAIDSAQRAVTLLPDDHLWRCGALITLGQAHQSRHQHSGDPNALSQAFHVLQEAAAMPTALVATRIEAARLCGDVAITDGKRDTALTAFTTAVELLPLLSGRQLRQADQERRLARQHGVACDAAACAITCGLPDRAVELLEAGRAILHAQVMETRNDLGDLSARAPDLARRFAALREELASTGSVITTELDDAQEIASQLLLDRRHELAREWADLVETIRTRYDGAGLFRPPRVDDLLPAAADGSVVTVNVSRYRCDALIVTTAGVHVAPLPGLAFVPLVERTAGFLRALDIACDGNRTTDEQEAAEAAIQETIDWLAETITQPIWRALGIHGPPAAGAPMPRIWWSPTSVLAFLPLHAAVLDQAVSSYTPTVGALLRARGRSRSGHCKRGLIVALPHTPGHARLPGVTLECDLLTERFPATDVLRGPTATRSAVLRELPTHDWVHLACHGRNDIDRPSRSNVQLWDAPLTVQDIFRLDTDQGGLAFLTACETAQGGTLLTDEALHIGGAFHLAGYLHVIATLWAAHDGTSVKLTDAFYRGLRDSAEIGPNPDDSATALHAAVCELRDRDAARPSRWAPYLHFGP